MLVLMVMMEAIVGLLPQVELECMFTLLLEVEVLGVRMEPVNPLVAGVEEQEIEVLLLLAVLVEMVASQLLKVLTKEVV